MSKRSPPWTVAACAPCPFSHGNAAEWCQAMGDKRIPDAVDVDRERPKWCPLPITLVPSVEAGATDAPKEQD